MRIAFDHQIFCFQKYGGVSRYFAELVRHFGSMPGITPCVVAPLHINGYLLEKDIRKCVRGTGIASSVRGAGTLTRVLDELLLPLSWSGSLFDVTHETYYSAKAFGKARIRVTTV